VESGIAILELVGRKMPLQMVLIIGLCVFLAWVYRRWRYNHMRANIRRRSRARLALSLFMSAVAVLHVDPDWLLIVKAAVLAGAISVPWCLYNRSFIRTDMSQSGTRPAWREYALPVAAIVAALVMFNVFRWTALGQRVVESGWPLLALCIAWSLTELFNVIYVERLR